MERRDAACLWEDTSVTPVKGLLLGCGLGGTSSCLGPRTDPVPDRSPVSAVQAVADAHGSCLGRQGADGSLGLASQCAGSHRLREGQGRRAELALSKIKTPCSQAGDLAWIPAGCGGILIYHTVAGQGASNTLHSVQLFNHSERVSWPFPIQESHREALFRGSKGGEAHRGPT